MDANPSPAAADPSRAAATGSPTELLGDLEGPVATVDRAGTVAALDAPWRVGWAVGAGDRWHVAGAEAAVRSRLLDDMPVAATAMRVSGADVIQRTAAVRSASGRGLVLEFVNQTPAPVSLALAVSGSIAAAQVHRSRLLADGRVVLELGRTPGGAVAVGEGDGWRDVWDAVRAGPPAGDCEARSRSRRAAAAVLVPLAAGVPLRVTVPMTGGPVEPRPPEQAAAGWLAVVSRAAAAVLPDETAARAWRRGIAACMLAAGGPEPAMAARAAAVLDRVGLPDEADRGREMVLRAAESSPLSAAEATAGLRALASRRLRTGRDSTLAEWAGPLADAAGHTLDADTLEQVAAALEREAPAAARDARRLLAETASRTLEPRAETADGHYVAEAVRAGIAFGGDGPAAVEAVLDCLVAEAADRIVIAPALPTAWVGASLDARSLATRHGRLSYSLRWHGARPAVLWELEPSEPELARPAGAPAPALRCGLDGSWTSSARAGEALLN